MKAIIAGILAATSACATDGAVAPVDQSGNHAGPAYLEVQFTDTSQALAQWPSGKAKLVVDIGRVEVQHLGGQWITVSSGSRQLDLAAVERGDAAVVATSMLPPAEYSGVRVTVDSATLMQADHAPQSVAVEDSIVELEMSTVLGDRLSYALVLDFDSASSMVMVTTPSQSQSQTPNTTPTLGSIVPAISLYSMARM